MLQTQTEKITGRQMIIHHGTFLMKNEGKEFNLNDPQREEIYKNVFLYFAGDEQSKYSLNKPLLTIGGFGVGKSLLFKIMQRVFPYRFYRVEALQLRGLVIENGASQTMEDFGYQFRQNLLIDDLGLEDPQLKVWGNQPNIFANLFYERHNLYLDTGIKTHIITNLTTDEMEAAYGERVLDRIIGDYGENIIVWKGESLRLIKN